MATFFFKERKENFEILSGGKTHKKERSCYLPSFLQCSFPAPPLPSLRHLLKHPLLFLPHSPNRFSVHFFFIPINALLFYLTPLFSIDPLFHHPLHAPLPTLTSLVFLNLLLLLFFTFKPAFLPFSLHLISNFHLLLLLLLLLFFLLRPSISSHLQLPITSISWFQTTKLHFTSCPLSPLPLIPRSSSHNQHLISHFSSFPPSLFLPPTTRHSCFQFQTSQRERDKSKFSS